MKDDLISPCGMNCGICSGYLAMKNDVKNKVIGMPYCTGCRPRDKKCAFLKKRCDLLMDNKIKFCYECNDFPCKNLQGIDKRYRASFRMSMIKNLEDIKKIGVEDFIKRDSEKWMCKKCGEMICCHNGLCFNCDLDKLKNKKKLYRWEDDL